MLSRINSTETSETILVPTFPEPRIARNRFPRRCLVESSDHHPKVPCSEVSSSAPTLKTQDPFLYYSQSRKRINELRFSCEASTTNDDDLNVSSERKTRFSTEVHPYEVIARELAQEESVDILYLLGLFSDQED